MSDNVYISIKGESTVNGESDKTELLTEGHYAFRGGKRFVMYKENMCADGESSTVLKIDRDKVTMTRTGPANTQMIFEPGKRHISHYETDFGSFTIGVTADKLDINVDDDGGDVNINYLLDINNMTEVKNTLHFNIRKAPRI